MVPFVRKCGLTSASPSASTHPRARGKRGLSPENGLQTFFGERKSRKAARARLVRQPKWEISGCMKLDRCLLAVGVFTALIPTALLFFFAYIPFQIHFICRRCCCCPFHVARHKNKTDYRNFFVRCIDLGIVWSAHLRIFFRLPGEIDRSK